MKRNRGTRILSIIVATFLMLSVGGILLQPIVLSFGTALLVASPIFLLIQCMAWTDAVERDDARANWRW